LDLNRSLNNQTLTPRRFVDFLNELQSGILGKKAVLDASGNPIPINLLQQTFDEITEKRAPWRGEWLNQGYFKRGKDLYMLYYDTQNGELQRKENSLEDCLMEDKQIDIFNWLARANSQGLPPKNVNSGNLYYWYPRADNVAGFRADAGRVVLGCNWVPLGSNAGLGVRAAISTGNISTKISQEESNLEEALEDIQGCIAPDLLPKVQEKLKKYF